ncbi:MAG TPA: type VI secretion system baseplate subunit TssG, partial [Rhodocyclaceae bacterium]|nr:type VI secretion system baseplate subunit TssG [Rhodocyclaceae bacterium]
GRRNHRLGVDSLLGSSMWDQQAAVRLEIGRMPFARALALLPLRPSQPDEAKVLPATRYAAFASLVQLLLDRRHDCEVHLHIATASIPPARLSVSSATTVGLRLGQTAWLLGGGPDATNAANPPGSDIRLHGSSIVRFRIDAYADAYANVRAGVAA